MNAAARLVHQKVLSRHLVLTHILSRKQIFVSMMGIMAILSALSVIYITHTSRILYANYQRNLIEQERLQSEHSQLLLERSLWMLPARTQKLAEDKLDMTLPEPSSVVVMHE